MKTISQNQSAESRCDRRMVPIDLQLIRTRLLNALDCPTRIMMLETTIASLMVGRESVGFGLEALAEFLGYDNRKSISRLLDQSAEWQRAANVSFCNVIRGERNVRRVHQFIFNRLNAAAVFVLSELESNPDYQTPSIARIDQHLETAILRFIRLPLATAPKRAAALKPPAKPTRRGRRSTTAGGGSVNSWDIFGQLPRSLNRLGLKFFPVDAKAKKPRIWKYRQAASNNPAVLSGWKQRNPDTDWAILTGEQILGGGFNVVVDLDLHGEGEKFGNGFKTLALREKDLGPLPETFTVKTPRDGDHRYFRTRVALPTWSGELGPGMDCKGAGSGFVIAPGSAGYTVVKDVPIADLPEPWQRALNVLPKTKQRIPAGERHDYLRSVSYAMACQQKQVEEIVATLFERLRFNCEPGGRTITERELLDLARSAKSKIDAADQMLDVIVA
jgi:hypothetical protein